MERKQKGIAKEREEYAFWRQLPGCTRKTYNSETGSVVPLRLLCGGSANLVYPAPTLPENCHQHALHRTGCKWLIIISVCRYVELWHNIAFSSPVRAHPMLARGRAAHDRPRCSALTSCLALSTSVSIYPAIHPAVYWPCHLSLPVLAMNMPASVATSAPVSSLPSLYRSDHRPNVPAASSATHVPHGPGRGSSEGSRDARPDEALMGGARGLVWGAVGEGRMGALMQVPGDREGAGRRVARWRRLLQLHACREGVRCRACARCMRPGCMRCRYEL